MKIVFFIPRTDSKIFQGAQRLFTFHISIFSLLSELANSVMKRANWDFHSTCYGDHLVQYIAKSKVV